MRNALRHSPYDTLSMMVMRGVHREKLDSSTCACLDDVEQLGVTVVGG